MRLARLAVPLLAVACVGAGLVACGGAGSDASDGAPSPSLFDPELVAVDRGGPFLHFGDTLPDATSIELGAGWGQRQERVDSEGLAVWIRGTEAELWIERPPAPALELVLRLRPLHFPGAEPQGLIVEADGRELARTTLTPGWQTVRAPVRRDDLAPGRTRFLLRFTRATRPADLSDSADDRPLAARVVWIGLLPAGVEAPVRYAHSAALDAEKGELRLPAGGAVDLPFPAPASVRLELGEVRRAQDDPELVIRCLAPGGAERELFRGPASRVGGLVLRTRVDEPGLARLRLEVALAAAAPGAREARGAPAPPEPRAALVVGLAEDALRVRPLPGAAPGRPSVFLYVIDTLRADALSLLGYGRPTSPALEAFARDAVVYERAGSPAAWTLPATISFLTGLAPWHHGILTGDRKLEAGRFETLAGRLGEVGYDTVGISHSFVAGPLFGVDADFGSFYLRNELGGLGLASGAVRGTLVRWLLERASPTRPVFAYLHTVDPHAPYVPSPLLERVAPDVEPGSLGLGDYQPLRFLAQGHGEDPRELARMRALYDGEVAHADAELGRFLDLLRHLGLYDSSLVAVVSDHGEEFLEHGAYDHGKSVHEEILHVPLLVKWPGNRDAGTRVGERVSTLDLAATILEACGLEPPPDGDGESLRPEAIAARAGERAVVARARSDGDANYLPIDYVAVARGDWKAIWSANGRDQLGREIPPVRVYRLATDPGELEPLDPGLPGAEAIATALDRARAAVAAADAGSGSPEVGEEALDALRDLGYVR